MFTRRPEPTYNYTLYIVMANEIKLRSAKLHKILFALPDMHSQITILMTNP